MPNLPLATTMKLKRMCPSLHSIIDCIHSTLDCSRRRLRNIIGKLDNSGEFGINCDHLGQGPWSWVQGGTWALEAVVVARALFLAASRGGFQAGTIGPQVVTSDPKWSRVVPNDPKRFQMVLNGFNSEWVQTTQMGHWLNVLKLTFFGPLPMSCP